MELKELPPCSTSPNHAMPCPPANMPPGMVFFFLLGASHSTGRGRALAFFFWLSYRSADPTKHATQSNGFFLASYSLQSVDRQAREIGMDMDMGYGLQDTFINRPEMSLSRLMCVRMCVYLLAVP